MRFMTNFDAWKTSPPPEWERTPPSGELEEFEVFRPVPWTGEDDSHDMVALYPDVYLDEGTVVGAKLNGKAFELTAVEVKDAEERWPESDAAMSAEDPDDGYGDYMRDQQKDEGF